MCCRRSTKKEASAGARFFALSEKSGYCMALCGLLHALLRRLPLMTLLEKHLVVPAPVTPFVKLAWTMHWERRMTELPAAAFTPLPPLYENVDESSAAPPVPDPTLNPSPAFLVTITWESCAALFAASTSMPIPLFSICELLIVSSVVPLPVELARTPVPVLSTWQLSMDKPI